MHSGRGSGKNFRSPIIFELDTWQRPKCKNRKQKKGNYLNQFFMENGHKHAIVPRLLNIGEILENLRTR